MHALFATLAIVVLACKMAAAEDQVYCYECTAGSAAECKTGIYDITVCYRNEFGSVEKKEQFDAELKQKIDKIKAENKQRPEESMTNEEKLDAEHEQKKEQMMAEHKQEMDKMNAEHKQWIEKQAVEHQQKMRAIVEESFLRRLKVSVERRQRRRGKKTPDDDELLDMKLIENDETLPMESQIFRPYDWTDQITDYVATEENIDKASIKAFNTRFSNEWKAAYEAGEKKKNGFVVDEWSGRLDGKHQDLISKPSTADKWCATFESKELGFRRGCGVVVEGYEFKTGCHNMSGPYQGVTYCRCDEEKCNGHDDNDDDYDEEESNEGVKLNGKIIIVLVATVLANFM